MRSCLYVLLAGLAACAELKSASPAEETDAPPATTTLTPTLPAATPAHAADESSSESSSKPPEATSSPDAGRDSGSNARADVDVVGSLCDAVCENLYRCSTDPPARAHCADDCLRTYRPHSAHLGEAFLRYESKCLPVTTCDFDCLTAWGAIAAFPERVPVVEACLSRRETCADDIYETSCYELLRYDEDTRGIAAGCFAKVHCADVVACLDIATKL